MASYQNLLLIAHVYRYHIATLGEANVDVPRVKSCYIQPAIPLATTVAFIIGFN